MKIDNIELGKYPVLLAPMEDVTDPAFRLMCKQFGADLVYTEFVSSDALIRQVNKSMQKLAICDEERPVAIQIYGRDVDSMTEAARIVEEVKPDIIDLNFGCPVKRVAGKGAGAGMLQNDTPRMGRELKDYCRPGRATSRLWYQGTHHTRTYPSTNVYRRGRLDAHRRGKEQSPYAHPHYRKW